MLQTADQQLDYPTREEEHALGIRCRAGELRAQQELVARNVRLVGKIVSHEFRHVGLIYEDLVQEGCIGLILATRKFDPDNSARARFSTYAAWWIRALLYEYVRKNQGTIKLTLDARRAFFKAHHLMKQLALKGEDLTDARLEADAGITHGQYRLLASCVGGNGIALDNHDDVRRVRLHAQIDAKPSPEDRVAIAQGIVRRGERIRAALRHLTAREQFVIEHRYLVDEEAFEKPQSLQQLGDRFDLSRERIRQIEQRAFEKLRKAFGETPVDE